MWKKCEMQSVCMCVRTKLEVSGAFFLLKENYNKSFVDSFIQRDLRHIFRTGTPPETCTVKMFLL